MRNEIMDYKPVMKYLHQKCIRGDPEGPDQLEHGREHEREISHKSSTAFARH